MNNVDFRLPENKYAPSDEKDSTFTSAECQCQVAQESASSSPLTPGLSSSLFIALPFISPSPIKNVLLPKFLQIKILPVTSPAATILSVGWKAKTVKFFVWCNVIFLIGAPSWSWAITSHTWSLRLFRTPKNFPEELMVINSGCWVCKKVMTCMI